MSLIASDIMSLIVIIFKMEIDHFKNVHWHCMLTLQMKVLDWLNLSQPATVSDKFSGMSLGILVPEDRTFIINNLTVVRMVSIITIIINI